MTLTVQQEPLERRLPKIVFRWDLETEILSGRFAPKRDGRGMTGSVEFEGSDGTFLLMEVEQGTVCGVEVVVWPDVFVDDDLQPPRDCVPGRLVIPHRPSQPGIGSVEVDVTLRAAATRGGEVIRLWVGANRPSRTIQIADSLCVDLDEANMVAGFWLLNVPGFPEDTHERADSGDDGPIPDEQAEEY